MSVIIQSCTLYNFKSNKTFNLNEINENVITDKQNEYVF